MSTRRRTRHSPEQIVKKLRDGEAMLNAGQDLAAVYQSREVSEATWTRWRNQHGGMKSEEAKRLSELEDENRRLLPLGRLSVTAAGMFGGRWRLEQRVADLLAAGRSTATRVPRICGILVPCGFLTVSLLIAATKVVAQPLETVTQSPGQVPESQADQAPAVQQQRISNAFGTERIHPSQRDSQLWRGLEGSPGFQPSQVSLR